MAVVPYIVEDGRAIRCLCKGCGEVLWRKHEENGRIISVLEPAYGDLYVAMRTPEGTLSEHSTPACPSCAERLIAHQSSSELADWWGADVFHWFIEERVRGLEPTAAYKSTLRLAADREPVRALRYVRST